LSSKQEKATFFQKYPNLIGASVVIEGFLDKEMLERGKIEVKRIEVLSISNNYAFSDSVKKTKSK
jgi:hypothetical protein